MYLHTNRYGDTSIRYSSSLDNMQSGMAQDCCECKNNPRKRILTASVVIGATAGAIPGAIYGGLPGAGLGIVVGGGIGLGVGCIIIKVLEEIGEIKKDDPSINKVSKNKLKRRD